MSNHTPQVETNLTVTRSLAVTVIVALATLAILLITLAINLFVNAKEQSDLLFFVAGMIVLGLALVPGKFLFEIIFEALSDKE